MRTFMFTVATTFEVSVALIGGLSLGSFGKCNLISLNSKIYTYGHSSFHSVKWQRPC